MKIINRLLATLGLCGLLLLPTLALSSTKVANVYHQGKVPTCKEANELLIAVLVEQAKLRALAGEDTVVNTIAVFEYQGLEVLKQEIGEFKLSNCPEARNEELGTLGQS